MSLHIRRALAAATFCLVLPALAVAQNASGLHVTGEGEVSAVPDMATITLGVSEQREDAGDAMDATSAVVNRILARLGDFEIAAEDVQTSDLSLGPVWRSRSTPGEPEIAGFEASNRLTVQVRDLDRLGSVLGAVLEDGANRLSGLQFGLSDPKPMLDEARRRAVADAVAKAQLYADAAGVVLGPIRMIAEGSAGGPVPMPMIEARAMSVPVAAGETSVSAQVSVVFELGAAE